MGPNQYVLDAVWCVYTCRRLIDLCLIAGTGEIPQVKLIGLVKTWWAQFEHHQAFELASRALRLQEVGGGAVHSIGELILTMMNLTLKMMNLTLTMVIFTGDLRLFLEAVAYCEEHW